VSAKWSIDDDHKIIEWIGPGSDHFNLARFLPVVESEELGHPGVAVRYRPTYFALQLLEASAWGKKPSSWYLSRIGIAAFFYFTLAMVVVRLAGPLISPPFLLFCLSRPYWAGMFACLGAGETYAVLGIALCAWGVLIISRRGITASASAFIAIGIIIAAGSKENFSWLASLPLYLLWTRSTELTVWAKLFLTTAVAFCLAVTLIVAIGVLSVGHDFYSREVASNELLGSLKYGLTRTDVLLWMSALFVAGVTAFFAPAKIQQRELLFWYIVAAAGLLIIFIAQFVFYSGDHIYDADRYLFPAVLARDLALLLASLFLVEILCGASAPRVWQFFLSIVAAGVFLAAAIPNLELNRRRAEQRVAETVKFTRTVEAVADTLKKKPYSALIMSSHHPRDCEPTVAFAVFLRDLGVTNGMAIELNYSSNDFQLDPLLAGLSKTLEDIEHAGSPNWGGPGGFISLAQAHGMKPCYTLGLRGPGAPECQTAGIWP